ncbi:hypothetical protein ABL78_7542 [Leptomonas seymouri]|uniref:Uncharacterized protein n=1 Tax=Leptomonas seymouri TaxID=5684 RepID=A0A0N1PB81_LEPSE|nr:hypothetical protein ABL78_7542 [Leptomonas seymouri]|eukprot:KPI83425.1 hypothetical protein ABL78_7542 [Leptomonas seymouri]
MASNEILVSDVEEGEAASWTTASHPLTPPPSPTSPTQSPDGTLPASGSSPSRLKAPMNYFGQDIQKSIRSRFSNLQGTLHSQFRNLQDNMANLGLVQGANVEVLRRRRAYHYDHSEPRIRSVRKLFDVVEQHHSWVSILLLLTDIALESAAVGIYLSVQRAHVPRHWLEFDWGMRHFIAEVALCVVFMSSWLALLAVAPNKWAYVLSVESLMSHLSSGWMLLLGMGSMLSQDVAWTRIYAPMFLRIWWLHEGLLALLSYPQISVCFTENRLEMLRSMIQCVAVIGISVGILQAVESFCGDPIEYFDMAYMMLLAFSTIGYGDVVPITVEGRLLTIVFIGVGLSYVVPLLEYVADLGVRRLLYVHYTTWFKRSHHIVICGCIGYNELRMQLKNILAEDRSWQSTSVVLLLSAQPTAQVELLLNSPKYRSSVHLLVGDPSNPADLDRCNARGASALFMYGAGSNSSYYSDYDVAKQAMTAQLRVPHVPLYVLLHRSRYTKSLMPSSANVLEFERLNHNLLGLGCVLPGMIPFVANLIHRFNPMTTAPLWELRDFQNLIGLRGSAAFREALSKVWTKKPDMLTYGATSIELTYGAEPNWMSIYEASLAQHVGAVDAPEVVRQGHYTFISLARLLYQSGVTLIGVERPDSNLRDTSRGTVIELGTRNSLVGVLKLIVICDERSKAQDIVSRIMFDALVNLSTANAPSSEGGRRSTTTRNPSAMPPPPAGLHATHATMPKTLAADGARAVEINVSTHACVQRNSLSPAAAVAPHSPPPPTSTATATTSSRAATPTAAAVIMQPRKASIGESGTLSLPPGMRVDAARTAAACGNACTTSVSNISSPAEHAHPTSPSLASPSTAPTTTDVAALVSAAPADAVARLAGSAASPTGPLRTRNASRRRDLEVPLSNHTPTVMDIYDDAPVEALASPVTMQQGAVNCLPKLSRTAPITVSPRGWQPSGGASGGGREKHEPRPMEEDHVTYAASPTGLLSGSSTMVTSQPNVMHLRRHYVFIDLSSAHERANWSREAAAESHTAKAADYYDAMRPVRQHDPDSDVVLLSDDTNYDSLANMWEEEDVSGPLIIVQGCGLFTHDLRRCNVSEAAAVVIFSAGDRCDEHGDTLSVLVTHLVRQLISEEKSDGDADTPIVVEVDHAELVPLLPTSHVVTGTQAQASSDWVLEPSFMSGCVVCRHMLDTGLPEMYFTPQLLEVLEQLLSSTSERLRVTVMAPDATWGAYADATAFGLENDLLPMAIHRLHEIHDGGGVSFRYIITNPPPAFPLRRDDFLYCLRL